MTEFFEGLLPGDTTYTNTVTFEQDDIEVSLTLTAEGFDGLTPAPLSASPFSAGVGVGDNDLNAGESIRFTYDSISAVANPGAPPIDPSTIALTLSSIRFAANFDAGEDTYTYTGVGAGAAVGDDTNFLTFVPPTFISEGDSFTITADTSNANGFSLVFLSQGAAFEIQQQEIPEPAALSLAAAAVGLAACRRRR